MAQAAVLDRPNRSADGTKIDRKRWQSLDRPSGIDWPVNEVLLQSLVFAGKSNSQIAELCGVDTEKVVALRDDFGL